MHMNHVFNKVDNLPTTNIYIQIQTKLVTGQPKFFARMHQYTRQQLTGKNKGDIPALCPVCGKAISYDVAKFHWCCTGKNWTKHGLYCTENIVNSII